MSDVNSVRLCMFFFFVVTVYGVEKLADSQQ